MRWREVGALLILLGSGMSLCAQTADDLLARSTPLRLGAQEDHVLGVTCEGTNFLWYGFAWADGDQQGRVYRPAAQAVSWLTNGSVASIAGDYLAGTSDFKGRLGHGTNFLNIPGIVTNEPAMFPVAVNRSGVVVGYTYTAVPFVFSNGVVSALLTPDDLPGAAVAITPSGNVIAGHVFPTNGLNTMATVWENFRPSLLSTQLVESFCDCATETRIGGSHDGYAVYWEKQAGAWVLRRVLSNSQPVAGEIMALVDAGYFGGKFRDGGAFLGKIGETTIVDLRGRFGLPSSADCVTGLVAARGQLAVAVDCADQAWGLVGNLTAELPTLSIQLLSKDTVRVFWPSASGVRLQSNPALTPTGWQDWTNAVSVLDGASYVDVRSSSPSSCFRLRSE